MKQLYCLKGALFPYIIFLAFWLGVQPPAKGQGTGYTLQGRVLSAPGQEPLPGASVQVKGTRQGSTTDAQGYFTVVSVTGRVGIRISFIGYHTLDTLVEVPLKKELALTLQPDEAVLEEVTVSTGYWESSKRMSTGNVGRITSREIANQPVGNALTALQGRIPGLEISQGNGLPGAYVSMTIRGLNSIASGNEPLILIDGIPVTSQSLSRVFGANGSQSPLATLNPLDIERIEVLKDADATAIYGTRGANGVVLIVTKKGREGPLRLEAGYYSGWGRVTGMMEFMDADQYIRMREEAFRQDGIEPTTTNAADLLSWDKNLATDWKKLLIGNTARVHEPRLSFSGGKGGAYLRVSGAYRSETTVFPGNLGDRRGSLQVQTGYSASDSRISAALTTNYAALKSTSLPGDLTGGIFTVPHTPVSSLDGSGPLESIKALSSSFNSFTHHLSSQANLGYRLSNGLSLQLNGGYTFMLMDETRILYKDYYTDSRVSGDARYGVSAYRGWLLEPRLIYKSKVGPGRMEALAGASLQQEISEGTSTTASSFSSESLLASPAAAAALSITASGYQYRYTSAFARLGYELHGRYIFNITGRSDGSSRFGHDRRFASFGSVGAAWIFSSERFARSLSEIVSFGKLRASYGLTGNDRIGNYQYLETYGSVRYPYAGTIGLVPMRLNNPDYRWETNLKLEAALELGLFNDRIELELSHFRNRSGNQLLQYTLPVQTGFAGIIRNFPAVVKNYGWEAVLSSQLLRKTDWQWRTSVNLTISRNRLAAFPGLETSSYASRLAIGHPLNIVKLYPYKGVDPQTGIYTFDIQGGQTEIRDLTPSYYGGMSHTLQYRRWALDLFFHSSRRDGPNYLYSLPATPGTRGYNMPVALLDRWQAPGDHTDIQRFTTGSGSASTAYYTYYRNSPGAYESIFFLRLKNLAFSYNVPYGNGRSAKIYLLGQNLLTLTDYQGNDPEVTYMSSLPPIRMLTVGFQLIF